MFLVYAHVGSLESRDLCTHIQTRTHTHRHACTHTHTHTTRIHTHTHTISQITQQAASMLYQKKALILKKFHTVVAKYVYLYSYHLATLPFSWKFNFDELSKCDKIC